MSTSWLKLLHGAAVSAVPSRRRLDRDRLHTWIDALAAKRGVPSWFERFTPHRIPGRAGDLHVDVVEAPTPGRVFVFMPGTNAYTLLYGEFLIAMADQGWTVVAFDPRGHGRSDGKRGSYTIDELLEDYASVVSFARDLGGTERVVVSGSSQGGIVAFYYALSDPSVDAYVCHNLADLSDPSSVALTRFGDRGHALRPWIERLSSVFPETPVPMQTYLDLRREPVRGQPHALHVLLEDPWIPWFVRAKTLASLGTAPPPAPIESMRTPGLVLQAGDDTIFPTSYVRQLVDRIPNADLELFPGLPHYMIVDHVDRVVPTVIAWLEQHVGGPKTSTHEKSP